VAAAVARTGVVGFATGFPPLPSLNRATTPKMAKATTTPHKSPMPAITHTERHGRAVNLVDHVAPLAFPGALGYERHGNVDSNSRLNLHAPGAGLLRRAGNQSPRPVIRVRTTFSRGACSLAGIHRA
jgi:hypothetical protein